MAHWAIGILSLLTILAAVTKSDLINPLTFADILRNYQTACTNNENNDRKCYKDVSSNIIIDNDNNNDDTDSKNMDKNKIRTEYINNIQDKYDWNDNDDDAGNDDEILNDVPTSILTKTPLTNLLTNKRNDARFINQGIDLLTKYPASCACTTHYVPIDLGYRYFPRYLLKAVCTNRLANSLQCWRGGRCKEMPYKVHVLTHRGEEDLIENDHSTPMLPDTLRKLWKFKTITIAASCQCAA